MGVRSAEDARITLGQATTKVRLKQYLSGGPLFLVTEAVEVDELHVVDQFRQFAIPIRRRHELFAAFNRVLWPVVPFTEDFGAALIDFGRHGCNLPFRRFVDRVCFGGRRFVYRSGYNGSLPERRPVFQSGFYRRC